MLYTIVAEVGSEVTVEQARAPSVEVAIERWRRWSLLRPTGRDWPDAVQIQGVPNCWCDSDNTETGRHVLMHIVETDESEVFRRAVVVWNVHDTTTVTEVNAESPAEAFATSMKQAVEVAGHVGDVARELACLVGTGELEVGLPGVWRLRDGGIDAVAVATRS